MLVMIRRVRKTHIHFVFLFIAASALNCPDMAADRLQPFSAVPQVEVKVDASEVLGPLELWRHCICQGGVSPTPLPNRIVEATRKLRPRLIRVFIQEFFRIYPEHGRFDWGRLDPYMEAMR